MHLGAHQGRHRAPRRTPRTRFLGRRTLAATAVASLLVTGVAVGAETVVGSQADAGPASEAVPDAAPVADSALGVAADRISRSTLRPAIADLQKEQEERAAALKDPRTAARQLLAKRGWADQFSCLDSLWSGESGWDPQATNAYSGAFGIPQALPATKMATAGSDWRTNPVTQIRWGLGYIESSYGSPCAAESFKQGHGWY
jgi:hypothetical protein